MEDWSKDYLFGRYGAIPNIKHLINWDKVHSDFDKEVEEKGRYFYRKDLKEVLIKC